MIKLVAIQRDGSLAEEGGRLPAHRLTNNLKAIMSVPRIPLSLTKRRAISHTLTLQIGDTRPR